MKNLVFVKIEHLEEEREFEPPTMRVFCVFDDSSRKDYETLKNWTLEEECRIVAEENGGAIEGIIETNWHGDPWVAVWTLKEGHPILIEGSKACGRGDDPDSYLYTLRDKPHRVVYDLERMKKERGEK